jgi:hypothetical protein
LLATSCLGPDLKVASEAQIGCQADEIDIVNEERAGGHVTWTAWCRGQPYLCSGGAGAYSCQAASRPQPVPTASARVADRAPAQTGVKERVRFEFPDCGVSANFPATPKVAAQKVQVGANTMVFLSAMFENATGALMLGCSDVPKSSKASMKPLLDGARAGMLENVSGKLLKESDIIGGREIWFDVQGHLCVARLMIAGDRMVMATVMPATAFGGANAKRFFDSVTSIAP